MRRPRWCRTGLRKLREFGILGLFFKSRFTFRFPLSLFFQQNLLNLSQLNPNPCAQCNCDDECNSEHGRLYRAVSILLDEQNTQVDEHDLLGQGEEGCDGEIPELDVTGGEDRCREVGGDDGKADDQDNLDQDVSYQCSFEDLPWYSYPEASVASDACHGAIVEIRPLQLESLFPEQRLECKPCPDCCSTLASQRSESARYSPSPKKVPAATMAKPIYSPQTAPTNNATISWPKSGGKEMMMRIAMGMSQPAGRSRSFIENGRIFCEGTTLAPPSPQSFSGRGLTFTSSSW